MPRKQRLTWTVVLRLAVVVTGFASLVVFGGGTALWLVEGERPDSTIRSWGDALWWSLTTLTTVGYGDHVPVTTTGRLIAAGVMVAGVAVIGACKRGRRSQSMTPFAADETISSGWTASTSENWIRQTGARRPTATRPGRCFGPAA
jgi:voltage-gated potassium channel